MALHSLVTPLALATGMWHVVAAANPQLNGMTVFGYQGWYPTTNYGDQRTNFKWFDPANGVVPGPPAAGQRVLTDVLPYVADYPPECTLGTGFVLRDGTNASYFNSYCTGVIEAHFKYMQKYKIDGIFVQRFLSTIQPTDQFYNDTLFVLNTVSQMAKKYNKFYAIEYDFSQLTNTSDPSVYIPILTNDYNNNVKQHFSDPQYIYNGNQPVLEVWGVGTNPTSGLQGTKFRDIIQDYQNAPEHPWVVIGIPHNWLDYGKPNRDPTGYWAAYQVANCLQPWPVGAFSNHNDLVWSLNNELLPGKKQADTWGIKYSGAFTPGGSNRNSVRNATYVPPLGNRYNGTFYEEELQLFSNTTIKPWFNFGAMFDEYTEGTQILPMLPFKNLPANPNPGFFGNDDNKDVFYYMALSGNYTAKFHATWGQQPLSP